MSTGSGTNFPSRLWTMFDYQGRLAQFWGSQIGPSEPVVTLRVRVANITADSYPGIIGNAPWSAGRDWPTGQIHNRISGTTMYVDTSEWTEIEVKLPIPAPRDGKRYTWQWSEASREWIKAWFATCNVCRESHRPGQSHCIRCEKALTISDTSRGILCKECRAT